MRSRETGQGRQTTRPAVIKTRLGRRISRRGPQPTYSSTRCLR